MSEVNGALDRLRELGDRQMEEIGPTIFAIVLLLSVVCGMLVALLYRRYYSTRSAGSDIHKSFPLLGLSITAIFICIQFSLPLSLGLLGALSIVRFRTPIKEPEEIGFLMVVIASSLACATFNFAFLALILVVAVVAVVIQDFVTGKGGSQSGVVLVSVTEAGYEDHRADILEALSSAIPKGRLESLVRNDGEVALSYSFQRLAPERVAAVEEAITSASTPIRCSVAFQRPLV